VSPGKLSTSEIVNFESVKPFRKSGIELAWKAQNTCAPNHPMPRMTILAGVILADIELLEWFGLFSC
jgi:hypothetical protein